MNVTKEVAHIIQLAFSIAEEEHYEYVTPEVILMAMCQDYLFRSAFTTCDGDIDQLEDQLSEYMETYLMGEKTVAPEFSAAAGEMFVMAQMQAQSSGKQAIELSHLLHTIWKMDQCYAGYYMKIQGVEETELLDTLVHLNDVDDFSTQEGTFDSDGESDTSQKEKEFLMYAPCINDHLSDRNPLIGREDELERTIQILCRKDKNNPIHIGEPGVGKTAITYGLARKINAGQVPEPLKDAKIYSLDLGSLLAGTQYRGDLEKRLKKLLVDISKEKNPIIYIDEIHNLAGAGAVGESSFDVSNILKPYLADGTIRFIGATTYEEYKKYFEKNKSLVRRFQNIEIMEPSGEETVKILEGLKSKYERFHGVKYGKGVLEYAVKMSMKHINERFLPDKAIDLIDEAGAYRKIHPLDQKTQSVGKDVINQILTKICHVLVEQVKGEEEKDLSSLEKRILSRVFGQDEAVKQVVSAVKYARAGLTEDHKPLSSFLFAGPTGVGKTEIAKTLADELGVKLIRFDMSEYGEKHAVAKLIGSPAGYVGYEEGGLLTEAIRKNPSSVLLLDEIEKAHPDIFHILLQVMDYATLTDNQGRKADFRNVIIIMTSNAGASQMGRTTIGFQNQDVSYDVISKAVDRIFQPEFRNRLNRIIIFKSIDDSMALSIAKKKLGELASLLISKKVEFTFTEEAASLLQKKGISKEYGAREIDRIIQNEIKPLLVDELLFGKLKKGGYCRIEVVEDHFIAQTKSSRQITKEKRTYK